MQTELGFVRTPSRSASRLAVQLDGYSLEAGTHVHEHDRLGLEHLCRYGLRAPFAQHRLSLLADGRVQLELRRPTHDGVQAVAFTPHQFLSRLAAIVPPPRVHITRYHGLRRPRKAAPCPATPSPLARARLASATEGCRGLLF